MRLRVSISRRRGNSWRRHVALEYPAAFPRGQAHVGLARVGATADDFGSRHARGGVVHLVLNAGDELLRFFLAFPVVASQGKDFADALVDTCFAGANLADAGKQLIKVVHQPAAALEPLVVQREPLDEVFMQMGPSPLAELGAAGALHP